jgi:hypothetical protein
MSGRWIKRGIHGGPDVWEYEYEGIGSYPTIALLKKDDRVIAEFRGPVNLKNHEIVKHIKSEYQIEGKLVLFRTEPSSQEHTINI